MNPLEFIYKNAGPIRAAMQGAAGQPVGQDPRVVLKLAEVKQRIAEARARERGNEADRALRERQLVEAAREFGLTRSDSLQARKEEQAAAAQAAIREGQQKTEERAAKLQKEYMEESAKARAKAEERAAKQREATELQKKAEEEFRRIVEDLDSDDPVTARAAEVRLRGMRGIDTYDADALLQGRAPASSPAAEVQHEVQTKPGFLDTLMKRGGQAMEALGRTGSPGVGGAGYGASGGAVPPPPPTAVPGSPESPIPVASAQEVMTKVSIGESYQTPDGRVLVRER